MRLNRDITMINRRYFILGASCLIVLPICSISIANPLALGLAEGAFFAYRVFAVGAEAANIIKWISRVQSAIKIGRYIELGNKAFGEIFKDMIKDGVKDFAVEKLRELLAGNIYGSQISESEPYVVFGYLLSSLSEEELDKLLMEKVTYDRYEQNAEIYLHAENKTNLLLNDTIIVSSKNVDLNVYDWIVKLTLSVEPNSIRMIKINPHEFKTSGRHIFSVKPALSSKTIEGLYIPSKEFVVK